VEGEILERRSRSLVFRTRWHVVAWSVLAAGGFLLCLQSYERWGDPTIDLGRDLYLSSRVLHGQVLYRAEQYNYGPVAPYLLAASVALFGDQLLVFESVGALVGLATMVALYGIGLLVGGGERRGALVGFFSALLFLRLSFFASSGSGFNFVLPYSYAATVATAFAAWSFLLLLHHLYRGRSLSGLLASGALALAALFTKAEVGAAIAMVHGLAYWTHRVSRKAVLGLGAAAIVLFAVFVGVFHGRDATELALFAENVGKFAGSSGTSFFFRMVAGLDRPLAGLLEVLGDVGKATLIVGTGVLIGSAPALSRRGQRRAAVLLGTSSAAVFVCLLGLWAEAVLFRATLVAAVGLLAWLVARRRRDPLLLLAAFVVFSCPRILFQYHPLWYGFYLAVPAYPFAAYLLGVRLPEWTSRSRLTAAAMAVIALAIVVRFHVETGRTLQKMTSRLVTSKGALRDFPIGRAEAIRGFLDHAERHFVPVRDTMVVFPEAVSLNYFTGVRNPTAYYHFLPPEVDSPAIERRIVAELEATRPDHVVLHSRDLTEYGSAGFCVDYAFEICAWIERNYSLERVFQAQEGASWRLVLLRKNERGLGKG